MSEMDNQSAANRQALQELRSGYSHTIDHGIASGEWREFLALYAPDTVVDYPDTTLTGEDEIEEFGHGLAGMYDFTMHTA